MTDRLVGNKASTRLTLPNSAELRSLREHILSADHMGVDGICYADGPCPFDDWRVADALVVSLIDEVLNA